jgi:hypothetical protein
MIESPDSATSRHPPVMNRNLLPNFNVPFDFKRLNVPDQCGRGRRFRYPRFMEYASPR